METPQQPLEQQHRRQQRAAQPQQQRQQHSTQLPAGLYMQQQQYQHFHQQVSAYTQQHARPQQRKKAPVSGSRRQRSDAGVPRGSRAQPNADDAQQQARRMDADFQAAYAAAYQQQDDQEASQRSIPAWDLLQQQLRALHRQQLTAQQEYVAVQAAQTGQARRSDHQRRTEESFKQYRAAAPALACCVLEQQAAPPAQSSCSVCQQTGCTIRYGAQCCTT